jgi:acetyltransferase-like isoleucine patch superfamily enzyme
VLSRILLIVKSMYIKYRIYMSNPVTQYEVYRKYYGVKIGKNSRFTGKNISFGSEPYLISIGDNVTIAAGVAFETHDGGVGVFRNEYKDINIFGEIIIGNNVFIGHRAIIMPGIRIGDNVVIGAGSIVTKDIPSNVVVAGIPAKILKTYTDYKKGVLNKAIYVKSTNAKKRKFEIMQKLSKTS